MYENHTLIILENDYDGQANEYKTFVEKNYPEIKIDFRSKTSGVGGGLFDENWNEIDVDLWCEYCNS